MAASESRKSTLCSVRSDYLKLARLQGRSPARRWEGRLNSKGRSVRRTIPRRTTAPMEPVRYRPSWQVTGRLEVTARHLCEIDPAHLRDRLLQRVFH